MKILISNNKGGTGKTAIAVNLFFLLQEYKKENYTPAFYDCDFGQWNGATWLNNHQNVYKVEKENLYIIERTPCTIGIIDTPPKIEGFQPEFKILIQYANYLLIPIDGYNAIDPGATTTVALWKTIKNTTKHCAIVLNKQKHISTLPYSLRKQIYITLPGIPVLPSVIPESQVAWEEALHQHIPVWKKGPRFKDVFFLLLKDIEASTL